MEGLIMKRRTIVVAGITVALFAGGGTALAATSSIPDSSGVIHACYKPNTNGSLSPLGVIDNALPSGKCPANQREVDWNQQGPAGPAGPRGPSGGVNIDRGVLTLAEGTDGGYTCSESNIAGPDAASITVVTQPDGCEIDGLSATNPFEVTPDGLTTQGFPQVGGAGLALNVTKASSSGLLFGFYCSGSGSVNGCTPSNVFGSGYTFNGTYDWMVILPS
jgi:hypothetical protein